MKYNIENNNFDLNLIKQNIKNKLNTQTNEINQLLKIFKSNENNKIIYEINENILNEIIIKYKNFYNFIKNENLLHIDNLKPLFDGNEIIKILKIKPGKIIGILIESLINIQIEEPKITKEEAINFLTKKRNQLNFLELENEQKSNKKKQ
jgi:tRNA nucleotidyltransferase/poly(A) polymerase